MKGTGSIPTLSFDDLQAAVSGSTAAIRAITRLAPAGGAGDKVFPPTYATGDRATTRYAWENRRLDGADVKTVLVDSVASQANRIEEALQAKWEAKEIDFPVVRIEFQGVEGLSDVGAISALQAPHRLADALLRDSVVKGTKDGWFRTSPIGLGFTRARPANATAVYASCPTALIFGVWDSTGPLGGQGAKFQRALVSEIVGVGATAGVKTASRLDPVAIQRAVKIYQSKTDEATWEVDESRAKAEKGKPVEFGRKGTKEKGLPSGINHGNVAPTIDDIAGGVTVDYAIQTTVLSLGALRKLRFQEDVSGRPLDDGARKKAEPAVRSALAALALAGITALREQGFDLRSRSLLVPEGPLILELVPGDGGEPERRSLSFLEAASLLKKAGGAAAAAGFPWKREPIVLEPSEKLAELIRRSRALAGRTSSDAEEAEG